MSKRHTIPAISESIIACVLWKLENRVMPSACVGEGAESEFVKEDPAADAACMPGPRRAPAGPTGECAAAADTADDDAAADVV